jgi:pectinesterase
MMKVNKDFPEAKLVISEMPKGVIEKKNLVYATYGKREMHIDLYLPSQKSKSTRQMLMPVVLLIHGGGWRSGFREMEKPMALFLASRGYIAATVEYRLSGEAKYPASVNDIQEAIKWLKSNDNKYGIDKKRFALYGTSSGGQIAALFGTNKFADKVQAVIDIDGVLDMTDPNESGKDKDQVNPSLGKRWFGYAYNEKPELWKEASAINHINQNSATYCFINSSLSRFHAGRDSVIKLLNKYNIYSEVHTIANTPHTFWLFHPWVDETRDYIIAYLNKIFKAK